MTNADGISDDFAFAGVLRVKQSCMTWMLVRLLEETLWPELSKRAHNEH